MNSSASWKQQINPHGLLTPFLFEPARHAYRLFTNPAYRAYSVLQSRYGSRPRHTACEIRTAAGRLAVLDAASFLSAYRAIFVDEIYDFPSPTPSPRILDCGANLGLGVLYFKRRYPGAQIVAFEPDPRIFELLRKNVTEAGFRDVVLINKAIWSCEMELKFRSDGADAGRIAVQGDDRAPLIKVPAVPLSDYLRDGSIDFLKLDVEGAEVEVLRSVGDAIRSVRCAFVEFHSFRSRDQGLGELIGLFERNGFRVHVRPEFISARPLRQMNDDAGMDMRLNLFFWRP